MCYNMLLVAGIRLGTHLVYIHVTLCSAPSLEHDERKVVVEFSGDDLSDTAIR